MSAARLLGALLPVLLLVIAAGGALWVLRQERRAAQGTRPVPVELGGEPSLEEWRRLPATAQEAYDTAVLDAAEAADATAARMAEAAKRNALFHP